MKKIKIRYLLPEMKLGGAERHVVQLASGLQKRGFDAGIVTVFRDGVLKKEVEEAGLPFACLNAKGWGAGTMLRIFNWLRTERPDVLHTYLFGFHVFGGFPAKLLNVPVILSSRRETAHWQQKKHLLTEKSGNFFVDRVICCSEAVRQWVISKENLNPAKTLTLYNGVAFNAFHQAENGSSIRREFNIPPDAPLVATVANFAEEKGYPYLIEAAERIFKQMPAARFLFVGAGPLENEMKEKAKQVSRPSQIIFTGSRRDIPSILAAADVFALASVWEGFPNVLLEAMAASKAVVASNVGGVSELIESGRDGVIVPSRSSEKLADAISGLLKNPAQGKILGERAAAKIRQQFTLEGMLDRYEMLYVSLMKQPLRVPETVGA